MPYRTFPGVREGEGQTESVQDQLLLVLGYRKFRSSGGYTKG